MAKIKEIKEVFKRLKDYVGCQRTDLQPIFMARLGRLLKELGGVIEGSKYYVYQDDFKDPEISHEDL